jgi:uncharacterized protein (DUF488 family)
VPRRIAFTVGYEGRELADFVALLVRSGVERVVDVRALPLSRRRGFSKTPLCEALARSGIDYVHLRDAGNPYRDLRDDPGRSLRLYERYLARHPAVLEDVDQALGERPAALLCLEARPESCHRFVLAKKLAARRPLWKFTHL